MLFVMVVDKEQLASNRGVAHASLEGEKISEADGWREIDPERTQLTAERSTKHESCVLPVSTFHKAEPSE